MGQQGDHSNRLLASLCDFPGGGWLNRNHTKLESPIQSTGDPAQHGQRAFIVRLLHPADHACGSTPLLCKFTLAESRFPAKVVDQLSGFNIYDFLIQHRLPFRIVANELVNELVQSVILLISGLFGGHDYPFHPCAIGFASYFFFRSMARSISTAGTSDSFEMPCEITTTFLPLKKYRIR